MSHAWRYIVCMLRIYIRVNERITLGILTVGFDIAIQIEGDDYKFIRFRVSLRDHRVSSGIEFYRKKDLILFKFLRHDVSRFHGRTIIARQNHRTVVVKNKSSRFPDEGGGGGGRRI